MHSQLPVLKTPHLLVRLAGLDDVSAIAQYYCENRAFLKPFEPLRPREFFTEPFWHAQVEANLWEFHCKRSFKTFIFKQSDPTRVIGSINLNQIVRGVAQYCMLGYSLAEAEQGRGYMTEALREAIAYGFDTLNLHRIMANYMPHNTRSGKLLKRLGFIVEGYARDYLMINGQWEDHILTSLTNPTWSPKFR